MAKGDFYFPLHYQKLLTSTIGWKDDEFGAYVRLLISQFDKGSIPNDLKELARVAPSIKKNWKRISEKFIEDGEGNLKNIFMDEIRQDVNQKKDNNSKNGRKGGRPHKPNGSEKITERLSESKPNGSENETQMKAILIDNSKYIKERENPSPEFFKIEDCFTIALADSRWVKANQTNPTELSEFNKLLERRGHYKKNPLDYKEHFSNWKTSGKKDASVIEMMPSNTPVYKKI